MTNNNFFKIQNRRYLGNKYSILDELNNLFKSQKIQFDSFFDVFAGTGVVGNHFNNENRKIISNDLLYSNYICLKSFLGSFEKIEITEKVNFLNSISNQKDNYFSKNFGGKYFSIDNAKKIGHIRTEIDKISESSNEKNLLLTSLIYAVDKVANTVGHYDSYRLKLDNKKPIKLSIPYIKNTNNKKNIILNEDANEIVSSYESEMTYIDPPYNSRQYSDNYHLLENLSRWEKKQTYGKARKFDRSNIKSKYSTSAAPEVFNDLITKIRTDYIVLSYNNTGTKKNGRSNSKISDSEILDTLNSRGKTRIFEFKYKGFTTGIRENKLNYERFFLCSVTR